MLMGANIIIQSIPSSQNVAIYMCHMLQITCNMLHATMQHLKKRPISSGNEHELVALVSAHLVKILCAGVSGEEAELAVFAVFKVDKPVAAFAVLIVVNMLN